MDLEEIKQYLRIDDSYDDVLIESLQMAAEEYLLNAGIEKNYARNLYALAIKMLIANWYETRQMSDKEFKEIPYGVRCIIQQLQY